MTIRAAIFWGAIVGLLAILFWDMLSRVENLEQRAWCWEHPEECHHWSMPDRIWRNT